LRDLGISLPAELTRAPFNLPAILVVGLVAALLVIGVKESANANTALVVVKSLVLVLFVAVGASYVRRANLTPFVPPNEGEFGAFGWSGVLRGAGVMFFAYIGFDAVSTAAQEARNPGRDMPIGILGSLAICTVLYILFAHVLTGIASVEDFRTSGREASVAYAIAHHMPGYGWLAKLVTVAILFGFTSVILVMLMGQSRVFFSMSRDGLVPKMFSDVHPKYRTPYKANLVFFGFVGAFAGFVPGDIVGDMTSIGTLFAFVLVCIGVWVLRVRDPNAPRQFRTPLVPLVPILGIVVNAAMIFGLGWTNWMRLAIWLAIGLVIYFAYGRRNSLLQHQK